MKTVYGSPSTATTISILHGDPYSIVSGVEVSRSHRRMGFATKWMEIVCDDADMEGITLVLGPEPQDDDSPPLDKLIEWYERFGFERWGEDEHGHSMIRHPRAPTHE